MKLDKFANPIFNEADIFDVLYSGHQTALSDIVVEDTYELSQLANIAELNFAKIDPSLYDLSIDEFDSNAQDLWFMPTEYYSFDVYAYCISKCNSPFEESRVKDELLEFEKRKMIRVLQWLKFFVDTCLQENIIWGVGRGSSVSSFVLYLLDVHKINSIKYNLDWRDFLR
jgi:DNA polymerase III alpha subunit